MEEVELRKEIEEKKLKKDKPELTSNKMESMKTSLEKEDKIRQKMNGLVDTMHADPYLFGAAS